MNKEHETTPEICFNAEKLDHGRLTYESIYGIKPVSVVSIMAAQLRAQQIRTYGYVCRMTAIEMT